MKDKLVETSEKIEMKDRLVETAEKKTESRLTAVAMQISAFDGRNEFN